MVVYARLAPIHEGIIREVTLNGGFFLDVIIITYTFCTI